MDWANAIDFPRPPPTEVSQMHNMVLSNRGLFNIFLARFRAQLMLTARPHSVPFFLQFLSTLPGTAWIGGLPTQCAM